MPRPFLDGLRQVTAGAKRRRPIYLSKGAVTSLLFFLLCKKQQKSETEEDKLDYSAITRKFGQKGRIIGLF